jgi:hypothetical protein
MASGIKKAGRGFGDFFEKLWHWLFPTADEVRWAIEQSLPVDEQIEWFVREAKTPGMGRVAIAATNRHLVILSHFLLWRYYDFHPWNKLRDVKFTESFQRSKLVLTRIDTQNKVIIRHIETERGRLLAGHARKMIAVHEAEKIALGKQCPHCKELIKYTANVCPNCHRELTTPTATPSSLQPNKEQQPPAPKPNQEPKKS